MNDTLLTATTAREYAARIASECSECFTSVKARKVFGKWSVEINGGSGACYGKTQSSPRSGRNVRNVHSPRLAFARKAE